jgi:predicted nucleic acid-binding protein
MIVVSDASPLIALSDIGQLDLMHRLYGEIIAPEAVWQELVIGRERTGRSKLTDAGWILRRSASNRELVFALLQDLDDGEAEAIALAVETKADLLLIDERLGRRTARHFGLNVVGVVGVLVDAKAHGMITAIKPYFEQLRAQAGFYLSDALYHRVLTDQGEIE